MTEETKHFERYKYQDLVIILYVAFALTSLPLGYKLIQFGPFIFSGAAFLVPLRSLMGDIIAEVYGYHVAKRQIINLIIAALFFAIISFAIIHLPSPSYWKHQAAFDFVLGRTIYTVPMAIAGFLIGAYINVYIVSYFRWLLKGRLFFLRSIGASISGELTQYIIVLSLLYAAVLPFDKLVKLIIFDYSLQLIFIVVVAVPASLVTTLLKRTEKIDLSGEVINFNPFKKDAK
ncbi:MAG: hypothetical protein A2103_03520 [Gammaproteobacteria bacterium GWF2_41_13]|nr:MAG: hypothetical protein A2103_03520 [Gammaproteobacteria bacterium GWF2_41_13]